MNYKKLMDQKKREKEERMNELLESGNDRFKLKQLAPQKKKQKAKKRRKVVVT